MTSPIGRSFSDALDTVATVDGWLSPDQARRLYEAAATATHGQQIVEIGSFRGRSTIVLASAAADGVAVVTIDPHAGNDRGPLEIEGFAAKAAADHEVFVANLAAAGVADRVTHVRAFSADAHGEVHGLITVLFIDGAHRYGPASADISGWGTRVADGGTMLIHDAFSAVGVTMAIIRRLLWSNRFRYVGRTRSLAEYRADLPAGAGPRLANALRQAAQLPWFVKNLAIKLAISAGLGPVLKRLTGRAPVWPY